jgi:hypothetical protein
VSSLHHKYAHTPALHQAKCKGAFVSSTEIHISQDLPQNTQK